jgi:hypothetical protein
VIEAINLSFATDGSISGYTLYIPSTLKVMISNQMPFDYLSVFSIPKADGNQLKQGIPKVGPKPTF